MEKTITISLTENEAKKMIWALNLTRKRIGSPHAIEKEKKHLVKLSTMYQRQKAEDALILAANGGVYSGLSGAAGVLRNAIQKQKNIMQLHEQECKLFADIVNFISKQLDKE